MQNVDGEGVVIVFSMIVVLILFTFAYSQQTGVAKYKMEHHLVYVEGYISADDLQKIQIIKEK